MKYNLSQIEIACVSRINTANAKLVDFADKICANPGHALEWSDSAFQYAAEVEVYGEILTWVKHQQDNPTPDKTEDEVIASWRASVIKELIDYRNRAMRSTSPASNLMHDCRREAWTATLQWMGGVFAE